MVNYTKFTSFKPSKKKRGVTVSALHFFLLYEHNTKIPMIVSLLYKFTVITINKYIFLVKNHFTECQLINEKSLVFSLQVPLIMFENVKLHSMSEAI